MRLQGNTFIVTGAASGLGAATVRMLVEGGANAVIADVQESMGQALAQEIGARARAVRCDVTLEADAAAAVRLAREAFGGLHGLINCAGAAYGELILGRSGPHALDSFRRILDINLTGTFNMIRLAAPVMAEASPNQDGERGVIVNTASVVAFDGQIGQAAYAASKAGIVGMMLPLARELARAGIRVLTIAPGIFLTPMLLGIPDTAQEALAAQVPFPPRLGRPLEFAALVRHMIENEMLNGEVVRIDGAIRLAAK
jgi:NAD(P)-dependent dehydrogenase (short-subunit alcohol dehydrogenase family)